MNTHDIEHRLNVYRNRFINEPSEERRNFYYHEIKAMEDELEAIEAVQELVEIHALYYTVTTDCIDTIKDLIENAMVVELDTKWSWRLFKPMFYARFYIKAN